jgi:hypothetical protein
MDFRFWREDTTTLQQIGHCPARRAIIRRYRTDASARTFPCSASYFSNPSGDGGGEATMEDHMNEVTDQAFVVVVVVGTAR